MRKRSRVNNGLDTNRYEIRVSTSNMFAHLDCLESRRPKTPGARNQSQKRPKHKSAAKKPEEEAGPAEGEWALVTRRSKKRESPAAPARVDAASCRRGAEAEAARAYRGREEEEEAKDEEEGRASEPCPGFNIDLHDDFPPLSRAGLPDGIEKKPRLSARKGPARADAQAQAARRERMEDLPLFQVFSDTNVESTDEEPSAGEHLNKLRLGGLLTRVPENPPTRTPPCAGGETRQPSAAEEAQGQAGAPGPSAGDQYITVEELQGELRRLLEEKRSSQEIIKWLQATVDDEDASSADFLEVLMTCVCQLEVIVCDVPHIDGRSMLRWTPLLKVFLQDQEKELTALKALGELMSCMQHPEGLLQMILDVLIDEELIQESTFIEWKNCEEQQGNLELLSSVSRFFCWLQGYLG